MIYGAATGAMAISSELRVVLLDTDALIDYSTCSIVAAEFETGLDPALLPRIEPYLEGLTYLQTSRIAARQAGRWRYEFRRRGVTLALTDCLIAATAHEHGAQIVTGNVRDYPMPGVTVLALPRVTP
jgi:predicted nucleic acid-binding protein